MDIKQLDAEVTMYKSNINNGIQHLKTALNNFLPYKNIDLRCYQSLLYEAIMLDIKARGKIIQKGIVINDFINDNGTVKSNIDLFNYVFKKIENKI